MSEIEYSGVDIVETTIEGLCAELFRLAMDGYKISPTNPGDVIGFFGNNFTVSMYRDKSTVKAFKEANDTVEGPVSLSRAEILAKARQAKSAKAKLDIDTITDVE